MKSPWKFLAQLTSPRRPAEVRESSAGHNPNSKPSESEAQQSTVLPLNSTEAFPVSDRAENRPFDLGATTTSNRSERHPDAGGALSTPIDAEDIQTAAHQEVSRSGAEAHALVPRSRTRKKSPRAPLAKLSGRAKNARTDMVSQSNAPGNKDESARSSPSREAFFDEVEVLDDEIRRLRAELAQKLQLQNIQLKRMLERFDVS
ncbi:hypothetical protein [Rhizobium sullae]|uniref:Uncharacterized protein n=1 Tax=Rhizobium sullae TaxID=50338 RepID=A0A4R3PVR8_RHISU|nr:hypothetical protein [Rhizobium sullae]TCU11758.1 hypothetical protein EV132_11798 [Rhizobium sullae]